MTAPHYGTLDEADAFHAARGNDAWVGASEVARSAALVRASSYIDGRYRDRFSGRKANGRSQALEWPRLNAADCAGEAIADDEVPGEVVHAAYEAALIELGRPGFFSRAYTPSEQKVLTEVKGIRWTVVGGGTGRDGMRPVATAVDGLLSGVLMPTPSASSSRFLLRA